MIRIVSRLSTRSLLDDRRYAMYATGKWGIQTAGYAFPMIAYRHVLDQESARGEASFKIQHIHPQEHSNEEHRGWLRRFSSPVRHCR